MHSSHAMIRELERRPLSVGRQGAERERDLQALTESSVSSCRCLQFKMFDDGSSIPATGIWPFPVQNGQETDDL